MQSETKKQSFMGRWSGIIACFAVILAFVSMSYGDIIIGNWESTMDDWAAFDSNTVATPGMSLGVTLGSHSLGMSNAVGWHQTLKKSWGAWWQVTPFQNATTVSIDVTMIASEWTLGSAIVEGEETHWGVKPLENLIVAGPSNWWEQLSPVTLPDFNGDGNRPGVWKPSDGDKTVTYTFNVPARGNDMFVEMSLVTNRGSADTAGRIYLDNARIITPPMVVSKCTVTAGKTQARNDIDYSNMKDAFTASGTLNLPDNVNDINSVVVVITSTTDGEVIYPETLEFDPTVVNKTGKYKYKGVAGNITSMTLDFRQGKFAIAAKNLDLTGLACPFELKFTLGSNEIKGNVDETVVNGLTKTIPTRLMRMYKDTLVVTPGKTKVKSLAKPSSDSLSIAGEIAVRDINATQPNLHNMPVVITWGDNDANNVQTFTILADSFKEPTTGRSYKLNSKINPTITPVPDSNTIVSGTIDLDKCTFALSITKADLDTVSGAATFGIAFADFNEVNDVNLAWKK
jgi:hypothetical protein